MLALLFLCSVWLNGLLVLGRKATVPNTFIIGSVVSLTPFFLITSYVTHNINWTMGMYGVIVLFLYVKTYWDVRMHIQHGELIVYGLSLLFGWYIFSHAFSYDSVSKTFLISSNTYMDFGAHIPFIRSFSRGSNFPAEIPFFAGSRGVYYFLTDFYAGLLEYFGLRIDIALNILSSLAFAGISTALYSLSIGHWRKWRYGILAILIFFSSNTLSWIQFLSTHTPRKIFSSVYHLGQYSTMGEVFWNLNTYVNQRQLLFGLALFLWFLPTGLRYQTYSPKHDRVRVGIFLGLLCYWHVYVFLAACLLILCSRREFLRIFSIAAAIALPNIVFLYINSHNGVVFSPGFIVSPLTLLTWIRFWIINTGILIPVAIIGMIRAGKKLRWLMVYAGLLFVIPNVFHISARNVFDDHKFFILWKLCMTLFCVYTLEMLWKKSYVYLLIFILCISGLLDFFVLKNDVFARVPDYSSHPFLKALPHDSILLTNGEIYDPASVAGHKTVAGRTQYLYAYGGDPDPALTLQHELLSGARRTGTNISYILCYSPGVAPNSKPCNESALSIVYDLVYTDTLGMVWRVK